MQKINILSQGEKNSFDRFWHDHQPANSPRPRGGRQPAKAHLQRTQRNATPQRENLFKINNLER
jgi:hypothetical protein